MMNLRCFVLSLFIYIIPLVANGQNSGGVCPLVMGSEVPNPAVKDTRGNVVKLSEVIQGKPSILVFYRGGWCPYCNAHLSELQKAESRILQMGYQIIGLSADKFEKALETLEEKKLKYKLYSDNQLNAAKAFGVAMKVDEATFNKYKEEFDMDLEVESGQDHHMLPVPGIFVIVDGKIAYEYVNSDYKTRISTDMLIATLENLDIKQEMDIPESPVDDLDDEYEADKDDVETIHGIVTAYLDVVSGNPGIERDWDRFRSLFLPSARITNLSHKDVEQQVRVTTVEQFIKLAGKSYEKLGLEERELGRMVDQYNGIAQVFQSYEANQAGMEERGINCYHLVYDKGRWWITNIIWTNDQNQMEIPTKYLIGDIESPPEIPPGPRTNEDENSGEE